MSTAESPFLGVPSSEWLVANRSAFAVADRFPVSPGHSLVVPRRLIATWWEASVDEKADLWTLVDELKALLDRRHAPDAYNVGFNAGRAAGQTVDHLHIHVIPRYDGDISDPRGGIRHVFPERANYLPPRPEPDGDNFTLFDGIGDRFLKLELLRCLINPSVDRIDLIVSFIMRSGLELIHGHLADALERGAQVRILTTDYMHVTDHLALARLVDLAADWPTSIETRIFRDPSTSFHPKAYIFRASTGIFASGFVGSSNLSASGIAGGVEWNVGVRHVEPLVDRFEQLWNDARSRSVDRTFLETYKRLRLVPPEQEPPEVGVEPELEPVAPRPVQREALDALEVSRSDGHRAGLVVLATGLGKTWLAAFDSARPSYRRVLFVAHREEILRQSRDVFRQVHPDGDLGMFLGPEKEADASVLFASIQTMANHLRRFDPEHFDYVVVDEFHHASAPSYRRLIDHFRPKFLLGLTATPQRMDGADLLALCNDNLVFECSLVEGIRRGELVPFQYWGVEDIVDFAPIPWRNGRFDPQALTSAVETRDRAEQAFQEWERRRGERTLAFCCSITHADFMQRYFADRGVRAAAVHSGHSSSPRQQSIEGLRAGELDVVFSIDMFNEGVDIPEVDTVLLLRPTDSPVIFLQQLGRGLRATVGKDHLRVVDLIGNHRAFLSRPRTLLTLGAQAVPSDVRVLEAMGTGDFGLPPGCSVDFELSLIDMFRHLARRGGASALEEYCRSYLEDEETRPSASQVFQAGLNPGSTRSRHGGWFGFLDSLDMLTDEESRVWSRHADHLRGFEVESVTRSYKLVVLRGLLRDGTMVTGTPVSRIAQTSLDLIRADPRLVADVQNDDVGDPASVDDDRWRSFWQRWPLAHLAQGSSGSTKLFALTEREGEAWFVPRFQVAKEDESTFEDMVAELVEWRLQRYLLTKGAADQDVPLLKLNHAAGRPIVMLDRSRFPNLPEGSAEFIANGELYIGRFVKVALNVAERPDMPGNALPDLLRGWFGPSAGHPGTSNQITLQEVDGRWMMSPVDRSVERGANASLVPLFADYDVACGALAASDATAARSGWMELADQDVTESGRHFVAFARGDSMDAGDDPVRHGDPLLFEWVRGGSASDFVGERVLVQQAVDGEVMSALKELDRVDGQFVLRSTNPAVAPISADRTMTLVARLVRRLDQGAVNPFASRLGQQMRRREVGGLFGMENSPDIRQSGYAARGSDAVLLVTLSKEGMQRGQEYSDFFEAPDIFSWSSQASTSPESNRGREVLNALETGMRLHLWVRPDKTMMEYEYCGLVVPVSHRGSKPIQVRFRLLTPLSRTSSEAFLQG